MRVLILFSVLLVEFGECFIAHSLRLRRGSRQHVLEHEIGIEEILEYERCGHVCTRGIFEAKEIEAIAHTLRQVASLDQENSIAHAEAMNVNDEAPFLQTFNPHRRHKELFNFIRAPKLTSIAAELLGTTEVRLYQTSLFLKRSGDGATRWHSDLRAAPIDTNDFITAWIPMHNVPASVDGGTGLLYAQGSHRDVSSALWYGPDHDLSGRYECFDHDFIAAGDVSWHHGWLLHSASENHLSEDRIALAVSFFADGAHLLDISQLFELNDEDAPSYSDWIHDLDPGDCLDHPLLPLVTSCASFQTQLSEDFFSSAFL